MIVGIAVVAGLLVGSFLSVVAWRVPRNVSIVRPRSSCPSCHRVIEARDNIPVVSWLWLRGRCRYCGEPISPRYPLMEAACGLLWGLVAWRIEPHGAVPAFCIGVGALLVIAVVDLDVMRVPDKILFPSVVLSLAALLAVSAADGRWHQFGRAAAGAGIGFAGLFLIHLVAPKGMGFGDVKLAALCGLLCGWVGWWALVVGLYGAFVLGAVTGVVLIATGRHERKRHLPFAPFLALATTIAVLVT